MRYRAVLIGCGNIGSRYANDPLINGIYTHAGAYSACSKTTLTAVCDTSYQMARDAANQWGVSAVYTDVKKMLQEQTPDIASICTPDCTHADMLTLALDTPSVKAILAEKPLALDFTQAKNLVELAKRRKVVLAVNYSRRYSKGHQHIKELLDAKKIGDIQKVSGFYTKGIVHNGTHWIDLARWFFGEIKAVQGFKNRTESYGDDPTLDAWFRFGNGANGFLQGLNAGAFSLFEMDILGTQGRMRLIDSDHRIEHFTVVDSPHYSGYKTLQKNDEEQVEFSDMLLNAVCDLVNCLENGVEPKSSGADGLEALRLALAIIKSSEQR